MDLQNSTKNQHFISQTEQRLNSINPAAPDEKQKIYCFDIQDRENYCVKALNKKGSKIKKSLCLDDLFSFDLLENQSFRHNFESLFHQYEASIKRNTESILAKLIQPGLDVEREIREIFTSKLINFIRNPYSIKKVLNSFPQIRNKLPTDPVLYSEFERILSGNKPHQRYLCNQLMITQEDYIDWLSIIFLLLAKSERSKLNFIEDLVTEFFINREIYSLISLYIYDTKTCLLSDRGFSEPLNDDNHLAFDFNLYSHGFIRFLFFKIDSLAPLHYSKNHIESFKSAQKIIKVEPIFNDLHELQIYNQNVIYQSYEKVFNSSLDCYGAVVI